MKFSSPCVLGLLSTVTLLAVGSDATIRGGDSNRGSRLGRTTSTSRHLAMGNTGKSSVSKSSKKSSKKSGKGDACFPAGAKVDVFDDETSNFVETNIEDVKTGDEVKCVDESTNGVGKCEVFFHYHPSFLIPEEEDVYLKVSYKDGEITLSDNHMLYIAPTDTPDGTIFPTLPPLTDKNFKAASNIEKGDLVIVENDSDQMVASKVKRVEAISGDTFYAPLVKGGRFFVDNTLASSYVVFPERSDAVNGEDSAHFVFNALYGGFLHNALTTGVLPKDEMWGMARDDPEYVAWETVWYFNYTLSSVKQSFATMRLTQSQNKTLTGMEAIAFEESVRAHIASHGNITDAEIAILYVQAVGTIEV